MKTTVRSTLLLLSPVLCLMLTACDPGEPAPLSADLSSGQSSLALTQTEFAALPAEDQYRVTNKLLGTFYRGVAADEFFDLRRGDTDNLSVIDADVFDDVRIALNTQLSIQVKQAIDTEIDGIDDEGNPDPDVAKYRFDRERPRQIPLARIKEYPISRDLFVNWMAYFLTNTIMFSPATEMESSFTIDAQRVFRFLVARIDAGDTIRSIIRSNLGSLHRWRVSRSAENHALEAYELYLGLFDTEEDSYRGGIACKDYYLTDESDDYLIDVTDFPNTEPQLILNDYFVTSCEDLYDVIAGHPAVIPRVTEVIANYLFSGRTQEERRSIINQVVAANPETFEDIFKIMLFSREYLLDTERPMSFEENMLGLLDRLHWTSESNSGAIGRSIFVNMANPASNSQIAMRPMGWDSMSLKIGRLPDVPLDALSFANYHKAMRESVLRNINAYTGVGSRPAGLIYDDSGDVKPAIRAMTTEGFIDFLFLTSVMRKPTDDERSALVDIIVVDKNYTNTDPVSGLEVIRDNLFDNTATLVFDYISRLPEFYYFKRVGGNS